MSATSSSSGPPQYGVYSPAVLFFNEDESIDFGSFDKHTSRLLDSGVKGLVIHGSNGEATHLDSEEKIAVIKRARASIDRSQNKYAVIIAGCSANSVRETIANITRARDAGADFALLLPPSYWAPAMTKLVIKNYYLEVAKCSALPILIYNFPAIANGIDLDSDLIIDIAKTTTNVVGAKLTCGNVGKLQRISSSLPASTFGVMAGKADFLLPGLIVGSNGIISALANVVPKVHVEMLRLWNAGEVEASQALQRKLSAADWALLKFGISGVKGACSKWFGYGSARARLPLPTVQDSAWTKEAINELDAVIDLEKKL